MALTLPPKQRSEKDRLAIDPEDGLRTRISDDQSIAVDVMRLSGPASAWNSGQTCHLAVTPHERKPQVTALLVLRSPDYRNLIANAKRLCNFASERPDVNRYTFSPQGSAHVVWAAAGIRGSADHVAE